MKSSIEKTEDSKRLDWLNRNYGSGKIKLSKSGIVACGEFQSNIRNAIDMAMRESMKR